MYYVSHRRSVPKEYIQRAWQQLTVVLPHTSQAHICYQSHLSRSQLCFHSLNYSQGAYQTLHDDMFHRRIVVPTDNEEASKAKHVAALSQTSISQQNINKVLCFVKELSTDEYTSMIMLNEFYVEDDLRLTVSDTPPPCRYWRGGLSFHIGESWSYSSCQGPTLTPPPWT